MRAELSHDAAKPDEFPTDDLPEVAFLGRSNTGKSSLINALVRRRRLARTSGRPGKTRRIHFYRVERRLYLVDLPGYGYAAAPRVERQSWRPMVESYLRGSRSPLRGAILVVDLRRGLEGEELSLLEWLNREGIEARLVLTKSDKLARSRRVERVRAVAREAPLDPEEIVAASSRTREGIDTISGWVRLWSGVEL